MLAIPTLKFSYGNLLLARLHERGSANIEELLGDDPAQLFKSEGPFENPERRARDCLRFAQMLDLVVEDERTWKLTASGITYAENVDRSNPWIVNDIQADILRDRKRIHLVLTWWNKNNITSRRRSQRGGQGILDIRPVRRAVRLRFDINDRLVPLC